MKRRMLLGVVPGVLCALPYAAHATSGDQMIGITATQWGMAGAFTAAPQDAAIVLFNPAGVAELGIQEVRADFGFGLLNPNRKANDVESDSKYYLMPGGALAFNVNDRLYFGMGMGGLSGMGVDFSDVSAAAPGFQPIVTTKQFYKIAPGFGYKVSDKLSVGAALNIDYQSLAIYNAALPGGASFTLPQTQVYGYGANLGLIYHVNDKVQIGASWISKQNMQDFEWNTKDGKVSMTMDGPQQFAVGLAVKPMPGLLIEADIKQIQFSDVLDRIDVKRPAGSTVPAAFNFGWDDQTVYAIGVQKDINPRTTVRLGFNYGESPIGPEDVNANLGSVAVVEKHVSLGLTRQFGNKVFGSLSYMHAFHNEVTANSPPPGMPADSPVRNKIELDQNIVNLQLSYKF